MVIDIPTELAPNDNYVTMFKILGDPKMDKSKHCQFPSSSSSSKHQTIEGTQRVGTYVIEKTIGKGNFSFVKLARHTVTNVKVAIKIIDKTKLNEENLKKAQREADILKCLHHRNIIKLYQVMESEKLLCIVTEYLLNGELYEYIAKNGHLNEEVARRIFKEILSAVEHCHLNNVVHRDLKAENVLLDENMSIKLADFGFGTFLPSGPDSLLTTWCGSPPYAAPEIFKGEPYLGVSADIWSLGVILYVLVCGVLPFNAQEVSCLRRQVLEEHIRVPYWLSMSCEELLKRMLSKLPNKRPSIVEIYNSKWLCEVTNFSLALDETDSKLSRDHLSASQNLNSTSTSHLLHRSLPSATSPPSSTLAAEMKAGKLDQTVIQIMENSGIDRGQLLESLGRCAYDHLTATYLLLGESLRSNRHSLPQTLAPRTEEISVLRRTRNRQSQHKHSNHNHDHQSHQTHARSSCPSSGTAVELLFQQHPPTWHRQEASEQRVACFGVKGPTSIPVVATASTSVSAAEGDESDTAHTFIGPGNRNMGDVPIYPSSHPRQGFLLGLTLPRVAEFATPIVGAGVGLRRTDASPSPPASPIDLSNRITEGDCFESDWFPYQWEGGAASPTPIFSFEGELTPRQSNHAVYGAPSSTMHPALPFSTNTAESIEVCTAALRHTNVSNPFDAPRIAPPETDLTCAAPLYPPPAVPTVSMDAHLYSYQHRRYSATGATNRVLHLPPPLVQFAYESRPLGEKSVNDEHTSGLGSSIEADSRHSSFSQPTAPNVSATPLVAAHFAPMETGYNEDMGIDIPARTSRKHLPAHSLSSTPSSAAAAALAIGCPRRKFGVSERPSALVEEFSRFQGHTQVGQLHQQAARSVGDRQQPTQPYNSMDF